MEKQYIKIAKLAPWISSENIGDKIIGAYCNSVLQSIFPEYLSVEISTRDRLSDISMRHVIGSDYCFLCGTNLLSSNMKKYRQWNITNTDVCRIKISDFPRKELIDLSTIKKAQSRKPIILFGVGWWQYQEKPDKYTSRILKRILSNTYLHSVRDEYSKQMLESIGINNVINTACPTMWNLTKEHCANIPTKKSDNVVTTLTNYNTNYDYDNELIKILLSNYKNVYVWLQAIEDYAILKKSPWFNRLHIIPSSLKAYDNLLKENIDYVGTRLHGGIRALNMGKRTIIIAVDNRAVEISNDTGLPIIKRENINDDLSTMIQSEFGTEINLPEENIMKWKQQFLV